jgi:hypothetical protein
LRQCAFGVARAGGGFATASKAGACLTAEAAKDKGLITAEQVDEVIEAAGGKISSAGAGEPAAALLNDAECQKVVAELREAAAQAK